MKNAIIIYLIQFVLSFSVFAGQQDTLIIEGHFYLDGKPVIIKIANGRFAEIQHKKAETGIPKMYIAPGLIDVQINGYMGVDFAG